MAIGAAAAAFAMLREECSKLEASAAASLAPAFATAAPIAVLATALATAISPTRLADSSPAAVPTVTLASLRIAEQIALVVAAYVSSAQRARRLRMCLESLPISRRKLLTN